MAYTITSPTGQRLFVNHLAPWQNDDLAIYADAIGAMFDPAVALAAEVGREGDATFVPGYGTLLDVDTCPRADLPYLAQYVGVAIPAGADDPTARSLVRGEAGKNRGTLASIYTAVSRLLVAAQTSVIYERVAADGVTPDAYHFVVVINTATGVAPNVMAVGAAIDAVKPGGVFYTLIETAFFPWVQATRTWAAETMSWDQTASIQP